MNLLKSKDRPPENDPQISCLGKSVPLLPKTYEQVAMSKGNWVISAKKRVGLPSPISRFKKEFCQQRQSDVDDFPKPPPVSHEVTSPHQNLPQDASPTNYRQEHDTSSLLDQPSPPDTLISSQMTIFPTNNPLPSTPVDVSSLPLQVRENICPIPSSSGAFSQPLPDCLDHTPEEPGASLIRNGVSGASLTQGRENQVQSKLGCLKPLHFDGMVRGPSSKQDQIKTERSNEDWRQTRLPCENLSTELSNQLNDPSATDLDSGADDASDLGLHTGLSEKIGTKDGKETREHSTTVNLSFDGSRLKPIRGEKIPTRVGTRPTSDPSKFSEEIHGQANCHGSGAAPPDPNTEAHETIAISPSNNVVVTEVGGRYTNGRLFTPSQATGSGRKPSVSRSSIPRPVKRTMSYETSPKVPRVVLPKLRRFGTCPDAFDIFEERRASIPSRIPRRVERVKELSDAGTLSHCDRNAGITSNARAPREDFFVKRLSSTVPLLGPSLKIYGSAEKIIMGVEGHRSDKASRRSAGSDIPQDDSRKTSLSELRRVVESATNRSNSKRKMNRSKTGSCPYRVIDGNDVICRKRSCTTDGAHAKKSRPDQSRKSTQYGSIDPFLDTPPSRQTSSPENSKPAIIPKGIGAASEVIGEAEWISPQPKNPASLHNRWQYEKVPRKEFQASDRNSDSTEHSMAYNGEEIINQSFSNSKDTTLRGNSCHEDAGHSSGNLLNGKFPPRQSSNRVVLDFTRAAALTYSPNSLYHSAKTSIDLAKEFRNRQNRLGRDNGLESTEVGTDVQRIGGNAQDGAVQHKPASQGVLKNFRQFLHRRGNDHSSSKGGKHTTAIREKNVHRPKPTNLPHVSSVHPIDRSLKSHPSRSTTRTGHPNDPSAVEFNSSMTPLHQCPVQAELARSTAMAMNIIERARIESDSIRRAQLLEIGKIMVDAVTQVRDSAKAVEEAKQAARKAEVSHMLCVKSLGEITKNIKEMRVSREDKLSTSCLA